MKNIFIIIVIFISSLSFLYAQDAISSSELKTVPEGVIVTPMRSLFLKTKDLTSNYGLAIIVMTLALRLALSPLQFISIKSMRKIQEIQPELERVKEKWKGDSLKLKEETLKIFKRESINPLAGLIPVLLQMPLFIAFYSLLTHSPEVVGIHFIGWLTNLSLPDPFYILPLMAGGLQLLSMMDGKSQMDNKVKFVMPVVLTLIMVKLPVAILIYTITSSLYSLIEKGLFNQII